MNKTDNFLELTLKFSNLREENALKVFKVIPHHRQAPANDSISPYCPRQGHTILSSKICNDREPPALPPQKNVPQTCSWHPKDPAGIVPAAPVESQAGSLQSTNTLLESANLIYIEAKYEAPTLWFYVNRWDSDETNTPFSHAQSSPPALPPTVPARLPSCNPRQGEPRRPLLVSCLPPLLRM